MPKGRGGSVARCRGWPASSQGIVEVVVPAGKVDHLVADVESLAVQGLAVTIARTGTPPETPTHRLSLELVGADRPGIVAEISALLSERHISIEELETSVRHAPMAGGMRVGPPTAVGPT